MGIKKGQKLPDWWKKKLSEAKKGRPSNWKGKHPTKEARLKMSLAKKGKKHTDEQREKNRQGQYNRHRRTNPDYIPDSWLDVRKKRIREQGGHHSIGEWETLKAQYDWICLGCGKREPEIRLTRDHIVPISRGGTDNIENIQPLCKPCNSKKNTRLIKFNPTIPKDLL